MDLEYSGGDRVGVEYSGGNSAGVEYSGGDSMGVEYSRRGQHVCRTLYFHHH